ncbi:MAG TPA: hypothetical protein VNA44_06130 [Burkholderiaceae bacterium]|nr:hypothetical protein [Burkholderiaceae bacterium]
MAASTDAQLQLQLEREMARLRCELRKTMPDNPAACGFKVYSQSDEDGIIETICSRLQLDRGTFVEIGCGDGHENNTHYLLLKDWRGVWIDADPAKVALIRAALPDAAARLRVACYSVTAENIANLLRHELTALGVAQTIDLLSIDIDGNDLPLVLAAEALSPNVLVVEYNAKFPYPMSQCVKYDPVHTWRNDDYHGASLGAWVKALETHYRLVCCNLAGTNAFFVRSDLAGQFEPCPPAELYQPARFYLTALRSGHPSSLSFLANHLNGRAGNVQRELGQ